MRVLMSLLALLISALAASSPAAAAGCDRFGAPSGSDRAAGTQSQPFRTAQRLADSLDPGQTGCLLNGTYSQEVDGPYVLNVRRGGTRGAPVTIRSAPGHRAQVRGIIIVPKHVDNVTISDLDIDARRPRPDDSTGIQINARRTILERNDITNRGHAICSVVGSGSGWGRAVRTIVRQNTFHDCGGTSNQLEHALYLENTKDVLVRDNLFLRSGTYAVHLYPRALRTKVTHNVMVDNGGGVIFAGEGRNASTGNLVARNIIVGTYRRPAIHSWWGGRVGRGNVARDNCLSNTTDDVDDREGGFAASSNLVAAPLFRDPGAGDYRLEPGSPCLALLGYDPVTTRLREAR